MTEAHKPHAEHAPKEKMSAKDVVLSTAHDDALKAALDRKVLAALEAMSLEDLAAEAEKRDIKLK